MKIREDDKKGEIVMKRRKAKNGKKRRENEGSGEKTIVSGRSVFI